MHNTRPNAPEATPGHKTPLQEELQTLQSMLIHESEMVIGQVEGACAALRECDREAAMRVRRRDVVVDREEVSIEEACLKIIALHKPVAIDLRKVTMIMKVNEDLERIADHAGGVAKAVNYLAQKDTPRWPPSLLRMTEEVGPVCRKTRQALIDESKGASRDLIAGDRTLNKLARGVFEEVEMLLAADDLSERAGLLAYRASRDIERIGDLCVDIAEDIIYFRTGAIVRHAKDRGLTP